MTRLDFTNGKLMYAYRKEKDNLIHFFDENFEKIADIDASDVGTDEDKNPHRSPNVNAFLSKHGQLDKQSKLESDDIKEIFEREISKK